MTCSQQRIRSRKQRRGTEPSIKGPQIKRIKENPISADPKSNPSNPCYGFVDGSRTVGGLTEDPVSLRARRPVLVNAIRFSESEGWSTVTLIARYEPSCVLFVGLYAITYCVRMSRTISFAI